MANPRGNGRIVPHSSLHLLLVVVGLLLFTPSLAFQFPPNIQMFSTPTAHVEKWQQSDCWGIHPNRQPRQQKCYRKTRPAGAKKSLSTTLPIEPPENSCNKNSDLQTDSQERIRIQVPSRVTVEDDAETKEASTVVASTLSLFKVMVGTGILALPFGVSAVSDYPAA